MAISPYATSGRARLVLCASCHLCAAVLLFLIAPILVIMPLSFNAEPYLQLSDAGPFAALVRGLLHQRPLAAGAARSASSSPSSTTILATTLGTLAALGLSRGRTSRRAASIMAVLISPMIVPVIISAVGMYFFYTPHRPDQHACPA